MTQVSFVQFRTGTPVSLPEGKKLTYAEFRQTNLQDFYLRIIHDLAVQGELTRAQADDWLKRLASKNAALGREVRRELEAKRAASVGQVSQAVPARVSPTTPAKRRARSEKVVLLTSRGDHKRAVIVAREYGLHPLPVPLQTLKPGQSPDAHTVRAVEAVASKLITTGNWKTTD